MPKYKKQDITKALKYSLDLSKESIESAELLRKSYEEQINKDTEFLDEVDTLLNSDSRVGISDEANFKELSILEYENKSISDIIKSANELYKTPIKIDDLFTAEELQQFEKEYAEIEKQFIDYTHLNKTDIAFLIIAVSLQMIRQYFQPKVNFDSFLNKDDRKTHDKTADEAKDDAYDDEKAGELSDEAEKDESRGSRYYYAKLPEIGDIKHVPYDVINGTKQFGVRLNGKNHRAKTLGHDPVLGLFFGTCNILTNTMSLSKDNAFRTLHIGKDKQNRYAAIAEANMLKMIEYSFRRFKESKATVGLAVIKQVYHIKSDEYSKEGIPLPFLQLLFDSEIIQILCEAGLDYSKIDFIATVGKQAMLSEIISYIVSVAHRVYIFIEKCKKEENDGILSKEIIVNFFKKQHDMIEVRTRKVIAISESIASIANALIVSGIEIAAFYTENPELQKAGIKYIDVGGYLSTIYHLLSDSRFITEIKREYIVKSIEEKTKSDLTAFE